MSKPMLTRTDWLLVAFLVLVGPLGVDIIVGAIFGVWAALIAEVAGAALILMSPVLFDGGY